MIIDTSVLIDFFRGLVTPATDALAALERRNTPFAIPTVCCQELLQGARDEGEWRLLHEYLASQPRLDPVDPWATHVDAARLYYACRRQGVTPRSTVDCLVAQLVLDVDGVLLHADVDFERIATVHPLRLWSGAGKGAP